MIADTRFRSIAPFFIVSNLKKSLAFYRDVLGFSVQVAVPEPEPFFALLRRDDAELSRVALRLPSQLRSVLTDNRFSRPPTRGQCDMLTQETLVGPRRVPRLKSRWLGSRSSGELH